MGREQNLKTIEEALKSNYLPVWNNLLGIEPTPLLSKIKKKSLVANEIVASAPIGLSGGFGYGEEGLATPEAGNVMFKRFRTYAKDMYTNVELSIKAVQLTGKDGSMANALDTEVKAAYETAKWNVGRSLFGNGTGALTKVVKQTTPTTKVEVTDIKYVKEGLIVDFYPTAATTPNDVVAKQLRIMAIDRTKNSNGNYEITLDKAPTTALVDGFMTVQNSFNREITGLGAIFDDEVSTIYGVSKADNSFVKPIVIDANDNVEDNIIRKALRRAEKDKNSKVDMLLCGDEAYDHYAEYLRVNNIRVEQNTLQGGFKSIQFDFANRQVDVVNEMFVPDDEIWGVDTSALELHTQEWKFADLQGGGIFNLKENSSVYRALLANYGDLICSNPGGLIRIYNCI